MATEYATLVFKADTKELGQAYNQLKRLNQQGKITDKTLQSFEKQMRGIRGAAGAAGKGLDGAGRSAGQAGIQIQQFVGQVSAGTNPMLAFSQQAADLGIVLGAPLLGAITAIGASIGMILLPSLLSGGRQLKDFDEAAQEANVSLRNDAPNLYAARMKELEKTEQEARDAIKETEATLILEQEQLRRVTEQVKAGILPRESLRNQTARFEEAEQELLVTLDQERVLLAQAIEKTNEFAFAKTQAEKATLAQLETQAQFINNLALEVGAVGLSEKQLKLREATLLGLDEAQMKVVQGLVEQKEAAEEAAEADKAADQFIERLEKQAATTNLTKAETLMLQSATLALTDAERERVAVLIQQIDQEEKRQQKLKEARAAEKELQQMGLLEVEKDEIDSFNRRAQRLEEFRAKGLISEQKYAEASKNLDRQRNEFAIKSAGDALNALGQTNETAFKIAKAYNIGQAIMNTYTGATKALAELPPPLNFIVAAATVAQGMAQVQQIRSQQFQGRALGGQVRAGESYVVGERGPEVLTMGSSGRVIPNEAMRGGQDQVVNKTTNVTFQISTVDARGFDQLLQSRRGQIISMINSASNDKGRPAVV